jgi:tetrahedral aminopeptidase
MIAGYVDETHSDAMGNLIALKRATTPQSAGTLMLAAHMDEIGVVVSYIDEKGFCRFHGVGGVPVQNLIGGRVLFENGTVGVIGEEKRSSSKLPPMEKLYIDVGATSREDAPVRVGDFAGFQRPFVAQGTRWIAKSMDDRIGCAILIQTLSELQESMYDIYAFFTAQEEVGTRGAVVSAFGIDPDVGIALDVTATGDTPECHKMAVSLGNGAAIKVKDGGMIAHAGLRRHLVETARSANIPYQLEVLEWGSTDARSIQVTRAGIPSGVISIPCRYVHTPSEMVDERDVRAAIDLLLQVVRRPITLDS